MAEKILMIALSPTMEEGKIASWKVKEGDTIQSGALLCEVETDKAVMEYESPRGGTILKIVRKEGETAKVGDLIALIGKPGEDISALLRGTEDTPAASKETAEREFLTPEADASGTTTRIVSQGGHLKSSPLARRLAAQMGLDIREVPGTGPNGRITRRDVLQFSSSPQERKESHSEGISSVLETKEVPVSGMRSTIARRLSESFFSAPHYFLRVAVRVDSLMDARSRFNTESGTKLSLNAFFIKLAAEAIKRHPRINTTWKGSTIQFHGSVDVGLAVALPDGLITPVVRNCEQKGIMEIDQELSVLIEKSRKGGLKPEEYDGATFTISNLGNFGIEEFTAIINPPGSAILALGEVRKEPVVTEEDEIQIQRIMRMTLSCDHRTIDGAVGAAFLRDLKALIEDPFRALL
jgi:pyruvate dehydrogenase E2 component (dihydrolipoamide acetyltransferase)